MSGHKYKSREWKNNQWYYDYGNNPGPVNAKANQTNMQSINPGHKKDDKSKDENTAANSLKDGQKFFDDSLEKAAQIQKNAQWTRDEAWTDARTHDDVISYDNVKFELMTAVITAWYEVEQTGKAVQSNRPNNLNSPEGAKWIKDFMNYQNMVKEAEDFQKYADGMLQTIENLKNRNGNKSLATYDWNAAKYDYSKDIDIPTDGYDFKYITEIKRYQPLNSEYKGLFSMR